MSVSGHQEVVMIYGADEQICDEMHFSVFNKHLSGDGRLERYAATMTKAAYCVIGDGLSLRGVVFFQFSVDESGVIDPAFNLPLRYLVQHAGLDADLGQGPIHKASRSQCPVPWHAVNLWEPANVQALESLQSRVYRNRLKLLTSTACRDVDFFPEAESESAEVLELIENDPAQAEVAAAYGFEAHRPRPKPAAASRSEQNQAFARRLNEVFGNSGKLSVQDMILLHSEQLEEVKAQFRDQLKAAREEIHELKVALRQEQGRSRRLQELLRGDL